MPKRKISSIEEQPSNSGSNRPRVYLSLYQKREIINFKYDNINMSKVKISEHFTTLYKCKIGESTVYDIINTRDVCCSTVQICVQINLDVRKNKFILIWKNV